jgi:Lrp/AsnC family leucine-responsive transcriptional regulator
MRTMTKSSREQILIDEMKILAELQKNSNESIDTIAKHCGFSRQKVWKTIKQLEKSRMIWGYTAIVDEQKQGLQKFILSIKRSDKTLDEKSMDEIAQDKLGKIISKLGVTIESSYYGHGEYDWILHFTANDLLQAKKFADLLLGAYPGIIAKVSLFQTIFIQREHRIPNPAQEKLSEFL